MQEFVPFSVAIFQMILLVTVNPRGRAGTCTDSGGK
jgi:hypothetical protein